MNIRFAFALALAHATLLAQAVTFNEHIAPILHANCAPCHRPGESAPFPLLTYTDARQHAAQIATVTGNRYMPPWPPAPGHGDFANSRRLTDAQLDQIAKWVLVGAPQGDPSKSPEPPKFTEGWQLGEPDLILRMAKPFDVPASGADIFRNFVLPAEIAQTRFVRAIELRPGNKRAVHHANIVVDRARSLRHRDGVDGKPGFPGMDVETESGDQFEPDSHFLFWKPGTVAQPEPAGMSWRLDPGTDLVVNLHLQPTGKPESVQAVLGLYFSPDPPTQHPILVQLEHDGAIDIPPGARGFSVTDQLKLPVNASLLAIYPHAHYIGKSMEAWATLPNGTRRPLLRIDDWDINWQAAYTYKEPVALPAGTVVAMRIAYDNTAANPRNPNHPPERVRTGDRSKDEMGHVWLQLLPQVTPTANGDPRVPVHQAAMRRRIEKYPADFIAHYNLGVSLQETDNSGAIRYLEKAVKIRPTSASARNALGGSFMAAQQLDAAVAQFREALRADAGYGSARVDLARILAAQGDAAGAARELRVHLEKEPDDAKAHYQLAGILAAEKKYNEALPSLRRAVELDPADAEMQANLGALLAIAGDLNGAVAAFERALKLNPADAVTRANLERARQSLSARPQ